MNEPTANLTGIPVSRTTLPDATDELLARAKAHTQPTAYRLVNSYTFALADQVRPVLLWTVTLGDEGLRVALND